MQPITKQSQLDDLCAMVNASEGGLLREAHLLSPSYLLEQNGKVYVTSGQEEGSVARLLICIDESPYGAVELILDGVCQANIPCAIDLNMRGEVLSYSATIQFTENIEDGFVVGRRMFVRYHDRSVWGMQPYFASNCLLDEEGGLIVDDS